MNADRAVCDVDAVIVLANLMDADGNLNFESAARASMSVEVYRRFGARYFVTCGWDYRDDSDVTIAVAFRSHLQKEFGIAPALVMVEESSRDTVGDAYFTKVNFALRLSWRRLAVVTSAYHVARTAEIFEFAYGDAFDIRVIGAPVPAGAATESAERKSLDAFRRTMAGLSKGDHQGMLRRMRESHPFYNGDVYEKI